MDHLETKQELYVLLQERQRRENEQKLIRLYPNLYPWQYECIHASLASKQRLIMAANRVGKTFLASYELSCHLTGQYHPDWDGIRFDHPIHAWALGVSSEQIRDVLQKTIFGLLTSDGFDNSGLIPNDHVIEMIRAITPKLAKDVFIKHVSGGRSQLSFKSYTQGQHALMGSTVDFALIDEEPEDLEIYPQVLTRTLDGNKGKGGYVLLSFTPENGYTGLVEQFLSDLKPGQYLKNVTWDDAPHLDKETKEQILASYPDYQRDMRSRGIPLKGTGVVFPISEEKIRIEPFKIPAWWPKIIGIDFGWDHPTALVWMAWDRDNDTLYVYDVYKGRETESLPVYVAPIIRSKGDWIPVAWPHDGFQHDKGSGKQLTEQYREQGVEMLSQHATFENGSNGVEEGIFELFGRFTTNRFKVFSQCHEWFEELRLYHRKNGKIVKERDDLLSATRYALMMLRYAEVNSEHDDDDYQPHHEVGVMGY